VPFRRPYRLRRPILVGKRRRFYLPYPRYEKWIALWKDKMPRRKERKEAMGIFSLGYSSEPEAFNEVMAKVIKAMDRLSENLQRFISEDFQDDVQEVYDLWTEELYKMFTHRWYRLPKGRQARLALWRRGVAPYARRPWQGQPLWGKGRRGPGKFARGKGRREIINIQSGALSTAVAKMLETPTRAVRSTSAFMQVDIESGELKGPMRNRLQWVAFGTRKMVPRRFEKPRKAFLEICTTRFHKLLKSYAEGLRSQWRRAMT